MKIYRGLVLLPVLLLGCVSTNQVAKERNAYYREYNYYEKSRFWRTIDIDRFENNLAAVRIAILAEQHTIDDMLSNSYLYTIYDSLHQAIEGRNEVFQEMKSSYFDSTTLGRQQIFTALKSDSLDRQILAGYRDSPYMELLEDLFQRYRTAVNQSRFYRSQKEFEDYLQNRSFTVIDSRSLKSIFNDRKVDRDRINGETTRKLKALQIDFLILFSVSYSSDYSEQAEARVGAEHVNLTCFSMAEDNIISEAVRIYFLQDDSGSYQNL